MKLDPADAGVGLEIWEFVSQQKSRHVRLSCSAQTPEITDRSKMLTPLRNMSMDPDRGGSIRSSVAHRPTREES